jgi:hypothetical protein
MGSLQGLSLQLPSHASLGALAAGFALWASVSEGQTTRTASSRDLGLLVLAAVIGAAIMSGTLRANVLGSLRGPG